MSTETALQYALRFHWFTTEPNPLVVSHSADSGQRGWRQHAVESSATEVIGDIKARRAACGLRAAHGWNLDLFIEKKCARCLYALGLACPECQGRGTIPINNRYSDLMHQGYCFVCFGGGMSPEARTQEKRIKEAALAKFMPATCSVCGKEQPAKDDPGWTFTVSGMAVEVMGRTAPPQQLVGPTVKWFCYDCLGLAPREER